MSMPRGVYNSRVVGWAILASGLAGVLETLLQRHTNQQTTKSTSLKLGIRDVAKNWANLAVETRNIRSVRGK